MTKKVRRFLRAFTFYLYNHWVTSIPWYSLRTLYLRKILHVNIGRNSAIHMGCFFTGNNIAIGNNTVINRNCYLDGRFGIEIGDNVSISPEVCILSLTHDINDSGFVPIGKKTVLKDFVWVGMRALILPGVQLPTGCIVGAGSVVTKSFDSHEIVAGVPAKVIGKRNSNLTYSLNYFPYFDTDII